MVAEHSRKHYTTLARSGALSASAFALSSRGWQVQRYSKRLAQTLLVACGARKSRQGSPYDRQTLDHVNARPTLCFMEGGPTPGLRACRSGPGQALENQCFVVCYTAGTWYAYCTMPAAETARTMSIVTTSCPFGWLIMLDLTQVTRLSSRC